MKAEICLSLFAVLYLISGEKSKKPLEFPILKLKYSLRLVDLSRLYERNLTNKACLEAIADICYHAKRIFTCKNTKCIFPNSPIPQCVNTAKVVDAESTHGAIKEILNPCKKTKVKFEVPTEKFLEDASKEVINRLKETLKEVNLEKLYETNLTNKACIDTITDICHNSKEKFSCRNPGCILPYSPPRACRNKLGEPDARSTHEAIVNVLETCKAKAENEEPLSPPEISDPYLEAPIKKLWSSLKNGDLKSLSIGNLTNKGCIDAIADACHDAKIKFSCYNQECLMIKNPPDACRNSEKFKDAETTYTAIKAVARLCKIEENL